MGKDKQWNLCSFFSIKTWDKYFFSYFDKQQIDKFLPTTIPFKVSIM